MKRKRPRDSKPCKPNLQPHQTAFVDHMVHKWKTRPEYSVVLCDGMGGQKTRSAAAAAAAHKKNTKGPTHKVLVLVWGSTESFWSQELQAVGLSNVFVYRGSRREQRDLDERIRESDTCVVLLQPTMLTVAFRTCVGYVERFATDEEFFRLTKAEGPDGPSAGSEGHLNPLLGAVVAPHMVADETEDPCEHGHGNVEEVVHETRREEKAREKREWNTELTDGQRQQSILYETHWDMILQDESRYMGGPTTVGGVGLQRAACYALNRRCCILLNGTLLQNHIHDLAGQFRMLQWPPCANWSWWKEHRGKTHDIREQIQQCTYTSDRLPEVEATLTRIEHHLPLGVRQHALLKRLRSEAESLLGEGQEARDDTQASPSLMGKVTDMTLACLSPEIVSAPEPGLPWTVDDSPKLAFVIRNLLVPFLSTSGRHRQVLVFSRFQKSLSVLRQYLIEYRNVRGQRPFHAHPPLGIHAGQNRDKERTKVLDTFAAHAASNDAISQKPWGHRILLCTYACAMAYNWQHACYIVLLDLPWSPSMRDQAEKRCHRPGQDVDVEVHTLVCNDPLSPERWMEVLHAEKRGMVRALLSGEDVQEPRLSREDVFRFLFRSEDLAPVSAPVPTPMPLPVPIVKATPSTAPAPLPTAAKEQVPWATESPVSTPSVAFNGWFTESWTLSPP